jgi:hypothetical protein
MISFAPTATVMALLFSLFFNHPIMYLVRVTLAKRSLNPRNIAWYLDFAILQFGARTPAAAKP